MCSALAAHPRLFHLGVLVLNHPTMIWRGGVRPGVQKSTRLRVFAVPSKLQLGTASICTELWSAALLEVTRIRISVVAAPGG